MEISELLKSIGIEQKGQVSSEGNYVIDIPNSIEYGKVFSKLENADNIYIVQDNQVVTEQGSSLMYEVDGEDYIINLIADWDSDKYQLIGIQPE